MIQRNTFLPKIDYKNIQLIYVVRKRKIEKRFEDEIEIKKEGDCLLPLSR
jgi:hypothetical protein